MDRIPAFSDLLSVDASQLPIQVRIQPHPVNPVHPVLCLSRPYARFAQVLDRMNRMDWMPAFSDSLSVDALQLLIQDRNQPHPVNPVHPVLCLWRSYARFAQVLDRMNRMDRMPASSDSLSVDALQLLIQDRIQTHPVNPVHPVLSLSVCKRLAPAGQSGYR
jgi:hypothetical protein